MHSAPPHHHQPSDGAGHGGYIEAQIYELAEEYTFRGGERSIQGVRAYGVTKDGTSVSVLIIDTPHEIYVDPVREHHMGLLEMMSKLDQTLLNNKKGFCRKTDCSNPKCTQRETRSSSSRVYPPCYESCLFDRQTDREAVSSADVVLKKSFVTYEPAPRPFWKFGLTRSYYANAAKSFFEKRGLDVYECTPDAVQSFVQLKNFAGFEWYKWPVTKTGIVKFEQFTEVKWQGRAPLRDACFDIETIAKKYNDEDSANAKYLVGCICSDDGEKRAYVLTPETTRIRKLGKLDGVKEEMIKFYDDELEMLTAFRDEVLVKANVWSGYNTDGFDIPYIFKRGQVLGNPHFCKLDENRTVRFMKDDVSGDRTVYCPGFLFVDFYKIFFKDTRNRPYDYKLDTVAEYLGLGKKHDMPYEKIHGAYNGPVEDLTSLVGYCVQDVTLTKKLGKVIGAMNNLVAKSRVKRIRPQDELYRGAAFVTTRLVVQYLREEGYIMVSRKQSYHDNGTRTYDIPEAMQEIKGYIDLVNKEGYTGGFVRQPVIGVYSNFSVGTLDFNSLYPSIMRTYNMCRSTQLKHPGELGGGAKEWKSTSGFAFAQDIEGIYPKIMRVMVSARNEVRAQIAVLEVELEMLKKLGETTAEQRERIQELTDEIEQLEALQNQLKIVANSLYGQTGAPTSPLFLKSAAQCTCERGAELAQLACHIIDEDPRMPEEWNDAQRKEYFLRMKTYESSLTPEEQQKFKSKRDRFRDVMGLKVIYGDTDSLMIWFAKSEGEENTLKWLTEVADYINKESGILGDKGILKMGAEDVSSMLLSGKKMYVKNARAIDKNKLKKAKIKIAGMDTRAKTPIVRAGMRDMVEAALVRGEDVSGKYVDLVQKVALGQVKDIHQLKHTSKLTKTLDEYANEAHAVAARQMRHDGLEVRVGDRIEYYNCLITNAGDKKADSVVAEPLVEKGEYDLDWRAYAEESIEALKPLKPLIKSYDKVSNVNYYHYVQGQKRAAPAQDVGIVGVKKRVQTAQAGPMDGFIRVQKSGKPKPKPRVIRAKGREFDEMDLDAED